MLPTGTLTIAGLLLLRTICRTFLLVLRLFVLRRTITVIRFLAISIGLAVAIILLRLTIVVTPRVVEIIVTRLYDGIIPVLFQLIDLCLFFFMGQGLVVTDFLDLRFVVGFYSIDLLLQPRRHFSTAVVVWRKRIVPGTVRTIGIKWVTESQSYAHIGTGDKDHPTAVSYKVTPPLSRSAHGEP